MSPVGSVEMWETLLFHSKSHLQVFEEGSDRKSELIKDIFSTKPSKAPAPEGKYKYTLPLLMWCSGLIWCEVFPPQWLREVWCSFIAAVVRLWKASGALPASECFSLNLCHGTETRGTTGQQDTGYSPSCPQLCQQLAPALILGVHEKMGKTQAKSALDSGADSGNPAYFNSCSHSIIHMTPSVLMGQWAALLRKKNQAYI